MSTHQMLTNKK